MPSTTPAWQVARDEYGEGFASEEAYKQWMTRNTGGTKGTSSGTGWNTLNFDMSGSSGTQQGKMSAEANASSPYGYTFNWGSLDNPNTTEGNAITWSDPSSKNGGLVTFFPTGDPNTGIAAGTFRGSSDPLTTGWSDTSYSPTQDYGLGPGYEGIVVSDRDAMGAPAEFLVMTPGGGAARTTDLAQAQQLVAAYKTQVPQPQAQPVSNGTGQSDFTNIQGLGVGNGGAAPPSTAPIQEEGILTKPRAGETRYEDTKSWYDELTNAQKTRDELAGNRTPTNAKTVFDETSNQPSEAEQYWNGLEGQFGNPNALNDYYDRQRQLAQTGLQRRTSSAGYGDSGAAIRAAGNLDQQYADRALLAMQDWAKTGMGLAGAADTGRNQRTQIRGSLAGSADSSELAKDNQLITASTSADSANLAKKTAGQQAADDAQKLEQDRLNGAITTGTTIGNSMANIAMQGMDSAIKQEFEGFMTGLQGQIASGKMTADQAMQKATEQASAIGAIANPYMQYYIMSMLGG